MDEEKGFVWYGLRISFYLTIVFFFADRIFHYFWVNLLKNNHSIDFPSNEAYKAFLKPYIMISDFIVFSLVLLNIFLFVLSILHLIRFKKKSFAVIALILSVIAMLMVIALLLAIPS